MNPCPFTNQVQAFLTLLISEAEKLSPISSTESSINVDENSTEVVVHKPDKFMDIDELIGNRKEPYFSFPNVL